MSDGIVVVAVVDGKIGEKLAPYNPTSIEVVHTAIRLLQLREHEIVYDLGCGDARFLVEVGQHLSITSIIM
jgi:hypothetical protein